MVMSITVTFTLLCPIESLLVYLSSYVVISVWQLLLVNKEEKEIKPVFYMGYHTMKRKKVYTSFENLATNKSHIKLRYQQKKKVF